MTKNSYKVRISSLLKLSSFNTQTAEGRSRERYRRASLSTIAAGLSKVVSILTGLITVPLTIKYLGAERYGLWMTISSTIAMLTFADLGIGNCRTDGHPQRVTFCTKIFNCQRICY